MAIRASKNNNVPQKKRSLEDVVKEQAAEIEKLKNDKLQLQVMTAELFEQTQLDKLEIQTTIAELAEVILTSLE